MPDVDAIHTYHGFRRPGAVCGIRIYRPAGSPPVAVATELPENEDLSITNAVEELAADVLAGYLPDRAGAERPSPGSSPTRPTPAAWARPSTRWASRTTGRGRS